jgi:hypothetical protein
MLFCWVCYMRLGIYAQKQAADRGKKCLDGKMRLNAERKEQLSRLVSRPRLRLSERKQQTL